MRFFGPTHITSHCALNEHKKCEGEGWGWACSGGCHDTMTATQIREEVTMFKKAGPNATAPRSKKWAFMERFEIPRLDPPYDNYLVRWRIIQAPLFAIYLHRMDHPDSRATLHDHPWNFISFVLRGGYTELVPAQETVQSISAQYQARNPMRPDLWIKKKYRRVRWFNVKRAEDFHSIRELHETPTWTLLLVGRRRREWGYLDENGWTAHYLHSMAEEFDAAMAARRDR